VQDMHGVQTGAGDRARQRSEFQEARVVKDGAGTRTVKGAEHRVTVSVPPIMGVLAAGPFRLLPQRVVAGLRCVEDHQTSRANAHLGAPTPMACRGSADAAR